MRRILASLGALMLVVFGSLALAAPASAYPPVPPALSIQSGGTTATGTVVQVTNAKPGSVVTFSYNRTDAAGLSGSMTATADDTGTASVTLPLTEAGTYSVVATGIDEADAPFTVSGIVTVAEAGTDGGGSGDGSTGGGTDTSDGEQLASTGGDNSVLLGGVALGALVLGGIALVASRGRRVGSDS